MPPKNDPNNTVIDNIADKERFNDPNSSQENLDQTGDGCKSMELTRLFSKIDKIGDDITRMKRALERKEISLKPLELQCRLELLNSYILNAMSIQLEIDDIDPENTNRPSLEENCVTTKALYLSALSSKQSHSNLPKMKLPRFSGKHADYKQFIALFESLVDSDQSLSNIEKFNHLLSCLSDEALGTVKAFQVSDENYTKALASLKRVYDNKCLIIFDIIAQLFDIPAINKPSSSALRSIIDTVSAIFDSLLSLGNEADIANAILIHIVMSKVDYVTKSKYEEQLNYTALPKWSECVDMLNRRYQHLSAEDSSRARSKPKFDVQHKRNLKSSFACTKAANADVKCLYCSANHHLVNCQGFSSLPVLDRFNFVKSNQLCINCLQPGHRVSNCTSSKCRVCSRLHHTVLHRYATPNQAQNNPTQDQRNLSSSTAQASSYPAQVTHVASEVEHVILATAVVKLRDRFGQMHLARALLDSGSQVNFMTERYAQALRLSRAHRSLTVTSVGQSSLVARNEVTTTVYSRFNNHQFSADFWVLSSITKHQPDCSLPISQWKIPSNLDLADPEFHKPQGIDLLLGADSFFDLLCTGQIRLAEGTPLLQKTLLGWVVSGRCKKMLVEGPSCCAVTFSSEDESLKQMVERFWEIENIPNKSEVVRYSPEQLACEEDFKNKVINLENGRFEVRLPFSASPNILGSSFETAKRRFLSLERRISKDTTLYKMYLDFMKEYLELGHMSETDNNIPPGPHYFIPHQCVLRPDSSSTKLRAVFDASCKTTSGKSLNDILMVGPTIQRELVLSLIRFRLNRYALTADIAKMYRQVMVAESDRNFQLIIWRKSPSEDLKICRLNTVTYGTASAPFLAIRCLHELGLRHKESHAIGSKVICCDFYVDDMLTGADDLDTLQTIIAQVSQILESAGFQLAKWFSNHPQLMEFTNSEKTLCFNDADSTKTLGMRWTPKTDMFHYHLDNSFAKLAPTKRNILSVTARLFDPLGLICPISINATILLQELWRLQLQWDETIPMSLHSRWQELTQNLLDVHHISIPRYTGASGWSEIQVHGFSDASSHAFGCCLYIRATWNGKVSCRLLSAKARVAPLKTKSIPRLELCAAVLLTQLWAHVKQVMNTCRIESVHFWTDSEITLHWINTPPSTLAVFVANRVATIQELSENITWRHVPSQSNPADIASRGCNVQELNESIWLEGPQFLYKDESSWPTNSHFSISQELINSESKKYAQVHVVSKPDFLANIICRFSSYAKLLRVFAYVYRFLNISKSRSDSLQPSAQELHLSSLKLMEVVQRSEFQEEFSKLKNKQALQPGLQSLTPFIQKFCEAGRKFSLIRVGGRLLHAPLSFESKFPILLPNKSQFVTLYLRNLHFRNCHANAKTMLGLLRQQIWIVNARRECTQVVRKCIHCFRYKPKLMSQVMGNLPKDRFTNVRPFLICGVDFCGPINVSLRIRGRAPTKMYIAVFVCFASKAVHLELVSDLSTNCFLLVLRSFIARRGVPKRIYSDNATNFIGARNQLKELQLAFEEQQSRLQLFAAEHGMEWSFIPPRAPHFGGLWEAAVKSAKQLLVRQIANASLIESEVRAHLADVEAILNSRPLIHTSADPNEGEVLTPGHLLIGQALRSLPQGLEPDDPGKNLSYMRRWQLLSMLRQRFWQAWSKDYVHSLQLKAKWQAPQPNLEIGSVVIVHDDNTPPQRWITGRVISVVTGVDGKVRVAEIKTATGVFKRPIHKLAVLPIH